MKTAATSKPPLDLSGELKPEYRLDYSKAKPNRFAKRMQAGSFAVVLDPDVAKVFRDAEAVNTALRALVAAMPAGKGRRKS